MSDTFSLDQIFEEHRNRLHALAFRMLGSHPDADDALQEAWLRANRAGLDGVENPAGWLTTLTARVCLNTLRSRSTRREDAASAWLLDSVVTSDDDPMHEAVLADAVGLAMLVVLDALAPTERVAFVLHDMFSVPFEDIAKIVGRSPDATRQLASRARRRMHDVEVRRDEDSSRRRELVDAFFAAARRGDLTALLAVLHPDVTLQADAGLPHALVVAGAEAVATRATMFSDPRATLHPVIANGEAGVVITAHNRVVTLMVFTVDDDTIVAIDTITDPEHLAAAELTAVITP